MCDFSIGLKVIVIIVVMAVVVIGIIGLIVALAASSRRCDNMSVTPVMPDTPMPSRDDRQDILKQLAQGEISKDQAEERLGALGTPVPADMTAPEPRPGGGRGCLIAALVSAILIPLVLLLLLLVAKFRFDF